MSSGPKTAGDLIKAVPRVLEKVLGLVLIKKPEGLHPLDRVFEFIDARTYPARPSVRPTPQLIPRVAAVVQDLTGAEGSLLVLNTAMRKADRLYFVSSFVPGGRIYLIKLYICIVARAIVHTSTAQVPVRTQFLQHAAELWHLLEQGLLPAADLHAPGVSGRWGRRELCQVQRME